MALVWFQRIRMLACGVPRVVGHAFGEEALSSNLGWRAPYNQGTSGDPCSESDVLNWRFGKKTPVSRTARNGPQDIARPSHLDQLCFAQKVAAESALINVGSLKPLPVLNSHLRNTIIGP